VDLPGRGRKARQAPAETFPEVVRALAADLPAQHRYAIIGHSLGGLIAYELARLACAEGINAPEFVVVAACKPPHEASGELLRQVAELDDDAMLDALGAAGFLSEDMAKSPTATMALPVLRRDLRLGGSYDRPAEAVPLPVDLYAWCGSEDRSVPEDTVGEWAAYTSKRFEKTSFTGGHFFLRERWEECAERLVPTLVQDDEGERYCSFDASRRR
jgi:surfactin synthase thioesterase subunit